MSFEYIGVEEAINRDGLRMVVVGGVPSPWGEAAKGFLHIKKIDWAAVRLVYDSEAFDQWAGEQTAPVAIFNDEAPLTGWSEILSLIERLSPTPQLLPTDAENRALMLELAHEFCSEGGLGWSRRLQLIHNGLQNNGGFPSRLAEYLGKKYGYTATTGAAANERVIALLNLFVSQLKKQQRNGSSFYVGSSLTAVDIYSAAFTSMFAPLPPNQADMHSQSRAAFMTLDANTRAALDPILLAHRDKMYNEYLVLPLSL